MPTLTLVGLLVVANTINIAADIGAMAEAVRLLVGGPGVVYIVGAGALCILGQVYFSYERTVRVLKWLTLALFAYVDVVMVPWLQAIHASLRPWDFVPAGTTAGGYAGMVVAVLGTTISPYLFFWQAAQEVEDNHRRPEARTLRGHPAYATEHLARRRPTPSTSSSGGRPVCPTASARRGASTPSSSPQPASAPS